MGILAGPIGWVITGALVSINLAGPAYRVTVPACVLVATLRKKLKAEQEAEQANKTNKAWYLAKAVLKNLKTLATKIKEWQQPLQNTKPPQAQKQQGSRD